MLRWLSLIFILALTSLLAGSVMLRDATIFPGRSIDLVVTPTVPRGLTVKPPLRFVAGWTLSSKAPEFGGISALIRDGRGFIALSDGGYLIRFAIDARSRAMATVESLPKQCGVGIAKSSRDSESMVRGRTGTLWVGFEYSHRICRIDSGGVIRLAHPRAMQGWPDNRGAEAMALLADGRIFVIGEGRNLDSRRRIAPGLIFDGDPAVAKTRAARFGYRLKDDYRATDAAALPDDRFLVLERGRSGLLSLPGRLTILPGEAIAPGKVAESRKIVWLDAPDLDQNFEGVAVSQARGRTFVWLISDDNFIPVQQTMLLLFEYAP